MPSYKAEVQYLKEVVKAYQLAVAFIEDETEGMMETADGEEKMTEALGDMRQVILNNVRTSSIKHNRTRGEFRENVTFPESWTNNQLKGFGVEDNTRRVYPKTFGVDLELWNDEKKEGFYTKSLDYKTLEEAQMKYKELEKYPMNRHVDSHLFRYLRLVQREDEESVEETIRHQGFYIS